MGSTAIEQKPLERLFVHQWIATDEDGNLHGTVLALSSNQDVGVSRARVFLVQNGRPRSVVKTSGNGQFVFANVPSGYYSLVAQSADCFGAIGVAVMDSNKGKHLPRELNLPVIQPTGERFHEMLASNSVPTRSSRTGTFASVRDPLGVRRAFSSTHRVILNENGVIHGRISQMGAAPQAVGMNGTAVYLLKDGQQIGRGEVAADGSFQFRSVRPGNYGLLAVGMKGIVAVGLRAEESGGLSVNQNPSGIVLVTAIQQPLTGEIQLEVADTTMSCRFRIFLTKTMAKKVSNRLLSRGILLRDPLMSQWPMEAEWGVVLLVVVLLDY